MKKFMTDHHSCPNKMNNHKIYIYFKASIVLWKNRNIKELHSREGQAFPK